MKNKEIQEQRMKDYFIQATKDILKGEGLKGLSVRNIADKAGYSYATLYNYFKDVNDLVFLCVNDFQKECADFVENQAKKTPKGMERIKKKTLAYMNYFTEYPGIFDLYFLAKVGDFGNKQTIINLISNSLDDVCEADWNYCLSRGLVSVECVEVLKSQLKYTTVGLLVLYLNRRSPDSYSEFMHQATLQIELVLGDNLASKCPTTVQNDHSKVQNSLISVNIG
jgi:AcrR family transcriptional regulator